MNAEKTGNLIRSLRIKKGLTQKELGDRLGGISQQQIGQWETGKANPKIETLKKIADALCFIMDKFKEE